MNIFVLKIIVCITMALDHTSIVLFYDMNWMNYLGRISFPIIAFLISEGYDHTKSLKKYFLRLIITAIFSQIPFMLVAHSEKFVFNTVFTLIIGLLSITIYDKVNKFIGFVVAIVLAIIAQYLNFDYGLYGVIVIFLFYVFRKSKIFKSIAFILSTITYFSFRILKYYPQGLYILKYVFNYFLPFAIFTLLAIIPISFYNGKQGYKMKYFFYIFYPLHLTILSIIRYVLIN